MKTEKHVFRISLFDFFLDTYLASLLFFSATVTLRTLLKKDIFFDLYNLIGYLLGACLGAVVILILAIFSVWLFPIELSREGIRGANFWGRYRFVAWDEINSVTKDKFLIKMEYLRVFHSAGNKPLWIPLFLSRRDNFEALIRDLVPEGNPLSEHFSHR